MKIKVLDGYTLNPGDLSWEMIEQFGELTVYPRTSPNEILEHAAEADILLTNKVPLTADTIEKLPQLKYIGVLATGYNIVDTEAASRKGIPVCNIPAYSTQSVAQMVFAHILAITNRVEHYTQENRNGKWSNNTDFCYWDTPLNELYGKTMGIVGLGHIGKSVAQIANAFGMNVCAFTSKSAEDCQKMQIAKKELNVLFSESDIITLHCPLTPDTRQIINTESLSVMKHSAILINTGRGPLIDEQAVADALQTGRLAAYGADVLTVEPAEKNNPLLHAPNIYLTPHIAWATKEARTRLMKICTENIAAFLNGQPQNTVNLC